MGAWGHGYFENDGAADVFAEAHELGKDRSAWARALATAFASFEDFLERDARGLTFRPISAADLAEIDDAVREALADFPNLVEEWDEGVKVEELSNLADTGDREAQGAVAGAALVLAIAGLVALEVPKKLKGLKDFLPDDQLLSRARSSVELLLSNQRLCNQFTTEWIDAVRRLLPERAAS